jgi:hypothetical protein
LFSAAFKDGSSPFDVVMVRYGGGEYDVPHAAMGERITEMGDI